MATSSKAIEYLEKGVKLNPNNTLMRFHLAEAYEANNRDAEAKKQIETLMATHSRSEVHRRAQGCGGESEEAAGERSTADSALYPQFPDESDLICVICGLGSRFG